MWLFAAGLMVLFAGAVLSLLMRRAPRLASAMGSATAIAGSLLALASAAQVLCTGQAVGVSIPWQVPFGSLALGIDPLSAVFVLPIAVIVAVAALYGGQYMQGSYRPSAVGPSWFFFNLLAATMLLVVAARNGLLFLLCWEGMSLASFFLVLTDHEQESVRRAGWIYLAAMHLGTACLLGALSSARAILGVAGLRPVRLRTGPGRRSVCLGGRRIWHESRLHSCPRLAAGGASRRAFARFRGDERRDDQDGDLRTPAHAHVSR